MLDADLELPGTLPSLASTALRRIHLPAVCALTMACGAQSDLAMVDEQPGGELEAGALGGLLVDVELSDTARLIVNEFAPGRLAVSLRGQAGNDSELSLAMGEVQGGPEELYLAAMTAAGLPPVQMPELREALDRAELIQESPAGALPPVEEVGDEPFIQKHLENEPLPLNCPPPYPDEERGKVRWFHNANGTARTYYEYPVFLFHSAAMGRGARAVRHTVEYWHEESSCGFTICGYGMGSSWQRAVPDVDLEDGAWHQVWYLQNQTEQIKAKVHSLYNDSNFDYCSYTVRP